MSVRILNSFSDSYFDEDNDSSKIINENQDNSSQCQHDPKFKNVQTCKTNQLENNNDPLLKIIFRDELTSRKYRRRIEDIIKYVMASEINENNQDESNSNLVLEIYDSDHNSNTSSKENQENDIIIKEENDYKLNDDNIKKKKNLKRTIDEDVNPTYSKKPNDANAMTGNKLTLSNYKEMHTGNYSHENNFTCFETSHVRIGSYSYFHADKGIFISKDGLTFFAPTFKHDKQLKILSIELDDIVKVIVQFSESKLYFFVSSKASKEIRKLLSMDDPNGPYFDPDSKDPRCQNIAIFPERISDESKNFIKKLFKNREMIEIDAESENDLNNKTTTKNVKDLKSPDLNQNSKQNCVLHVNNNTDESAQVLQKYASPTNNSGNLETTLFCCVIRIGSYEYAKKRVFSISKNGIKFCIPMLNKKSSIVTLTIGMDDIKKIVTSFSKILPVLFFYVTSDAAKMIRKVIGMNDPNQPYFDPDSPEDMYNKIIILPASISTECKMMKELISQGKIETTDEATAKTILTKSFSSTREENQEIPNQLCACFTATTLRIGSYTCDKYDLSVRLTADEMKLNVPQIAATTSFINVTLKKIDVTKVMFHSSTELNVLFFHTTESFARSVRTLLRMHHITNKCFDPNSKDIARKRLVIVIKHSNVRLEPILRHIYNKIPLEKISIGSAQSMLQNNK